MKLTKPFFTIVIIILISTSVVAQSKAAKIEDLLQRYYDYGLFNGSALVAEDGNIIFEKGFGLANMEWNVPNTPDTKFRIGSISKQFTSTIIMQLVEEGKIKLDAKLTDYLPNYRKDTGDKVTIHHLLNHTSGITPYTSLQGVWSDSLRNHYKQDYFIEHFHSGDLQFEPGSKYVYNNTGYYLLAVIAEKVTGKGFGVLLKERIFDPLKMRNTGSEDDELIIDKKASGYLKSGRTFQVDPYIFMLNAMGAGHIYSTVEDMLLWDQALYSTKILSEESKNKMFTPYLSNYGYGWIIAKDTIKGTNEAITITAHDGGIYGFNTSFVRVLEKKIMIAIFNNTGPAPLQEMAGQIIQILYDQEFKYPKRPIQDYVAGIVETEGIEAAISAYKKVKQEEFDSYDFSEQQLNNLGYYYFQNGRIDEALAIFKLNIEAFPLASNPYDSYAEALMKKGDKEGAIENYKKSIDINPGNTNGIEKLKELGVEYKKELTVENKILSRYTGNYQLFPNFIITVRADGDKIFAQATGQAEFEIFPSSETKFYYKVVNAQIEFVANENGDFNKMILYQNNREMPGERVK
ncbi:MAG: serine hydrolase [Ignavibacteria bacterium RIFOXYB2_FULL_35_12]|nr:MAG: serine hydrolase [Ignavibacteria bacterium GWA2_36_19]OGU81885.1 MAG: serine hydrolase [Ignavibacteria bacterium RIFOXYA2_FULL_35_9]OGU88068.1 MAG: serine hydrolase [Ignavibacteria bacterium RIFOXYA12_FULL_35_25]OGU93095.1 MAG: serine hydrolase [Ignavibacteria bacterium RIFOXYB12_FULL_35_14]OGU98254.1 MAG: serine hydrolase [Ignavibacteria bacterium RIFOXYC2_FULL_35_16]OGV03391.1 MAG: serine hydrolase [Ignavibacteria bacterium RIFOXYB2_FULL_35_12]OGV31124.1 MAG: serine hydrolase [Ignav